MPLTKLEIERLANMPESMIPFVRMPCGCVGIKIHEDFYISVWDCDTDENHTNPTLRVRQHNPLSECQGFEFERVGKEVFINILGALQDSIGQGQAYCDLRRQIKWMVKDHGKY